MMRTTVTIDQDVLDAARNLAHQRGISLGAAISVLARRGLTNERGGYGSTGNEIPTFVVAESAPPFGTEEVRRALEEE